MRFHTHFWPSRCGGSTLPPTGPQSGGRAVKQRVAHQVDWCGGVKTLCKSGFFKPPRALKHTHTHTGSDVSGEWLTLLLFTVLFFALSIHSPRKETMVSFSASGKRFSFYKPKGTSRKTPNSFAKFTLTRA